MLRDEIRQWISALGGRRFLMTVGAGAVHTGLLTLGFIDQSIFRDLTIATVAVYVGANTYQKGQEAKSE